MSTSGLTTGQTPSGPITLVLVAGVPNNLASARSLADGPSATTQFLPGTSTHSSLQSTDKGATTLIKATSAVPLGFYVIFVVINGAGSTLRVNGTSYGAGTLAGGGTTAATLFGGGTGIINYRKILIEPGAMTAAEWIRFRPP